MELLSPAGGYAQLKAAVQSGADAVYMGGSKFGARHSAKNFDLESMREMTQYCHLYGVDVHVTVNTLIKEKELWEIKEYLYNLNDINVDALIIQDLGIAALAREIIPDMPLHASTQMTVTSLEGVRYLEEKGFSRVVLARELSKEEIEYICKNAQAEIEVFVHGAICMCYSGQCLMSSILGGRSGNRGRCAQPCRLPYTLLNSGKTAASGYLLSPKDMSLIDELSELKKIGVASLKIEGRLKRPEYVSAVTGVYRKYLDNPSRVSREDYAQLKNAFSRTGFTDGYYKAKLGKAMMSHENPSNATENTFEEDALKRALPDANVRKIPIGINAVFSEGCVPSITVYDNDGNYATGEGNQPCEKAKNKPLDIDRVKVQLEKLGQTPFLAKETEVYLDEGIAVSLSSINEARRNAVEELIKMRSRRETRRKCELDLPKSERKPRKTELSCSVRTKKQAMAAMELGIDRIYAPEEIAMELGKVTMAEPLYNGEKISTDSVMVSSAAAMRAYKDKKLYGDYRLNVFNSLTAKELDCLESITLSPELNLKEIKQLVSNTDSDIELIAYGKQGLMLMKNCPLKAAGHCQKNGSYKLKDRKNEEFSFICHKGCVCELINSKPVFMADKIEDLISLNVDFLRLTFTDEDYSECKKIITLYKDALNGKKGKNPLGENEFTRGHYYRGVE